MIDKNEMLQVFKEMLQLWELMAQSNNGLVYESRKCIAGFCYYLMNNEPSNANAYLKALEHDKIELQDYNFSKGYWYKVYYDRIFYFKLIDFKIVIENQFQPRIDHLKRTIARLENELKEQKK